METVETASRLRQVIEWARQLEEMRIGLAHLMAEHAIDGTHTQDILSNNDTLYNVCIAHNSMQVACAWAVQDLIEGNGGTEDTRG